MRVPKTVRILLVITLYTWCGIVTYGMDSILYYKDQGDYTTALKLVETQLKQRTRTASDKISIYEIGIELCKKENHLHQALAYTDSLLSYSYQQDSLLMRQFLQDNKTQLKLIENEQALLESEEQARILCLVLFLLIGIVFLIVWIPYYKISQNKRGRQIITLELESQKNATLLLETQMLEQEALTLLQQEKQKNEHEMLEQNIAIKNNELISSALFLANRNKLIMDLIHSLTEKEGIVGTSLLLNKTIEQIKRQLNEGREWDNFFVLFEETNGEFLKKLLSQHPTLTVNETRFLSLIYIDLNMKEVALLLNITPEYCKKKKQQISKKLGIASPTMLYNYLFDLSHPHTANTPQE